MRWDTHEVDYLAADLSQAPARIQRSAPRILDRGAIAIKNRIERAASGHDFLPYLDDYVSWDRRGLLVREIGFDPVGQGRLENIAVYGSINNAPVMGTPAELARLELGTIERDLGDEGEDAVLGRERG